MEAGKLLENFSKGSEPIVLPHKLTRQYFLDGMDKFLKSFFLCSPIEALKLSIRPIRLSHSMSYLLLY